MSLASTWLDLVVGVDLHLELVPTPVPTPTPFPHPHCSVVFDPVGYIVGEVVGALTAMAMGQPVEPAGPVLIGGRMSTVTGDAASMPIKHIFIPPGTAFVTGITPSDAELLVGSKTVLVRGANAVRAGEVALSCSEPVRLPTSAVVPTSGGPAVTLIGGPPAIDFGMAAGMLGMRALRNTWTAGKLHAALDAVLPDRWARLRRLAHKSACFFTGHPVNVSSGTVSTSAVDLTLPGPIPLQLERDYDSNWSDRPGPLGFGWSHTLDQSVWIEPGAVVLQGGDGRELEFHTHDLPDGVARRGDRIWHPVDRCTLVSFGELRWEVEDPDGRVRVFSPIPGESPAERDRGRARLVAIHDAAGNAIALHYDERARLVRVVDSAGRTLELENDAAGRLRRLWAPSPDGQGMRQHAEYRYDAAGDLVEVVDACGKSWRFEYDEHLLVRERDREGLSFYFVYDGRDRFARCVRTWGDGGIHDHVLDYDRAARTTLVTNSCREITRYQMDGLGMVTEILQADGTKVRREYEPTTWLAAETDEAGATTRYQYDARGNRVMITLPKTDAGPRVTKIRYDAKDRPIEVVDPTGATWAWRYDGAGRVVARVDPLGHTTTYAWEQGRLVAVIDAAGHRTAFEYGAAHDLAAVIGPDGSTERWQHDALGRPVAHTDAKGNVVRRQYDALGRIVRVEEPDGNIREVVRDGEGRIVRARDRLREVTQSYVGMGWLASRTTAGTTVQWRYDTEGRVTAVLDERGQEHRFERDLVGRVRIERGIGGVTTRFERDPAGRVVREFRPGNVEVKHTYDAAGARLETVYPEGGVERFAYDRAGRLSSARNADAEVIFERDAIGRAVKETTTRRDTTTPDRGQTVVERAFDHRGLRVGMSSSLGAKVSVTRDAMGDVGKLSQGGGAMAAWEVSFTRDVLGDELERAMPGGVRSVWWRDAVGRPTQHAVSTGERVHRMRKYGWGVDDRLLSLEEQGEGARAFEHDGRGMLVATRQGEATVEGRWPDDLGRIFDTPSRTDRAYGPGGELQWRQDAEGTTRYEHDGEGRCVARTDPDGGRWRYHWNDAGRLSQVDRPDGTAVALGYDALGRRLSKRAGGVQTCFVWDGDVVLHEWGEASASPEPRPLPGEDATERALLAVRAELRRTQSEGEARAQWASRLDQAARGFPALAARLRLEGGFTEPPVPPAADDVAGRVITWLFAPGSHAPLARLTADGGHGIVTDQVGAPLVVLGADGEVAAQLVTDSRGRARVEGDDSLCPWRYAGQYRDRETGLHYNRFRYYDADAGQYISRDPLGLRAGLRVYGYVADPGVQSDPLGLSPQPGGGCGGGGDGATVRVGRWMSKAELEAMMASGKVQASAGGITHVTVPANPDAFAAAAPGSVFTEFDVASGRVDPGGREDWGIISGPESPRARLAKRKGEELEMPDANNIEVTAVK